MTKKEISRTQRWAEGLSYNQKKKYLYDDFDEDNFRDRVVRQVFTRNGFVDGRDMCGTDEEGKDCIFFGKDNFGDRVICVVQTKRGDLKMSAKLNSNITEALAQLRMCIETEIFLPASKERVKPDFVYLCTSGTINTAARRHITSELRDPRIKIHDSEWVINQIDNHYGEFWWGIDADKFPYLSALKDQLTNADDTIQSHKPGENKNYSPIADSAFVSIYANRLKPKVIRHQNVASTIPEVEEIPVEKLPLAHDKAILLVGEAGGGKTTTLRRIAYSIATNALEDKAIHRIPVFVRAYDFAISDTSLSNYVCELTSRISAINKPAFGATELEAGDVVVLIDGLDEIAEVNIRESALVRVDDFRESFPRVQVIASTRNYRFVERTENLQSYARYDLSPINFKQAKSMVEKISAGRELPDDVATELVRRLDSVHGIELNPLLVTVFVATTDYHKKDIPANITEIFDKYTELLLGRWDEKKGLGEQYQSKLKSFLLCKLAFRMHQHGDRDIQLSRLSQLFKEWLEPRGYGDQAADYFDSIVYKSNLLIVDNDSVRFRHHLLQEYFAGRSIPDEAFLLKVLDDEWWTRPIVFYFGSHPDKHSLLESLTQKYEAPLLSDGFDASAYFNAAKAIGLALQACYLNKIDEKKETLRWVISTFASSGNEHLQKIIDKQPEYPLSSFAMFTLDGRESIAAEKEINEVADEIMAESQSDKSAFTEAEIFWSIAGLIEAGQMDKAFELVKTFKPEDLRFLFGLNLGAFFVQHLRASTPKQKKVAKKIVDFLAP